MEPSPTSQNLAHLSNPNRYILDGDFINQDSGIVTFTRPWLYITILPNMDFNLRINYHFKPDLNALKKPLAELQGEDPFLE
jgi:hypothetical protein